QSFCTLCSWPAAGAINRRNAIRFVLFDFGACLERRRSALDNDWSDSSGSARRRIGMHNGHRRCVGRVLGATSSRAACKTTIGKYLDDRRDTNSIRRSEEHTSELQSLAYLVCRLLLE